MSKKSKKRIFGVDPGFDRCGFGVLDYNQKDFVVIDVGCITTDKNLSHAERLREVRDDLTSLIEKHQPDLLAIEELFFSKNVKTALKVAEARGVILELAARSALPVIELNPNQIKLALTGDGRADKKQMQQMVKTVLQLPAVPEPDDAADALAVAIASATVNPAL